jgi:hypothetical protein
MATEEKVKDFINEYRTKVSELSEKILASQEHAEYLTLEIRMIKEHELPKSQADEVLNGTTGQSAKLKKQLAKYQESLQLEQEKSIIYANALSKYKYRVGEDALKLEKLFKEEKSIQEKKHYNKMMYFKRQYIDALIENGQRLKEANAIDFALQTILVESGRKSNVYVDSSSKHTVANTPSGRYLALNHAEVTRFILGSHSSNDYDYLKPYSSLKDLK